MIFEEPEIKIFYVSITDFKILYRWDWKVGLESV